ncbi:MAG: tetratricopeptide repeat protein [Chloroflexi bacterium]|nr:tetratricopeptide repeat protein [Chloroflexota bacterium]
MTRKMWRIWPALKWVWATVLVAAGIGILVNRLFASLLPEVDLFLHRYWWALVLAVVFLALVSLWSGLSWRDKENQDRRRTWQEEFDLFKTTEKLVPRDLRFQVVQGDEPPDRQYRPYHPVYVKRRAVPFELRGQTTAIPIYDEDRLRSELCQGKSFILVGQPTDGKSRTLYEVVHGLRGHTVIRPKRNHHPSKDALSLVSGKAVILLLDDLNFYVDAEVDLLQLCDELNRQKGCKWAVAAACKDGTELDGIRQATSKTLHKVYEDILPKFTLQPLTDEEKQRVATGIGKSLPTDSSWEFPTVGSIILEDAFKDMRERFDRRLSGPEKDCLRAMQLLGAAGVVPFTHSRIRQILADVFQCEDIHLRDGLEHLATLAFLHYPGDRDPVWPEAAYLSLRLEKPVVPYLHSSTPHDHFPIVADSMQKLADHEGLFSLGVTYALGFQQHKEALDCFQCALAIRPSFPEALVNKGVALGQLGRSQEEVAVYDEVVRRFGEDSAPALREPVAKALFNKGVALGQLGRSEEAVAVYDEVVRRFGEDSAPALREPVAKALFNKGVRLGQLGRSQEAVAVYDEVVRRFGEDSAPALREQVAQALFNKGVRLGQLGRSQEAVASLCRAWRARDALPDGGELVASALRALGRDPKDCNNV